MDAVLRAEEKTSYYQNISVIYQEDIVQIAANNPHRGVNVRTKYQLPGINTT